MGKISTFHILAKETMVGMALGRKLFKKIGDGSGIVPVGQLQEKQWERK